MTPAACKSRARRPPRSRFARASPFPTRARQTWLIGLDDSSGKSKTTSMPVLDSQGPAGAVGEPADRDIDVERITNRCRRIRLALEASPTPTGRIVVFGPPACNLGLSRYGKCRAGLGWLPAPKGGGATSRRCVARSVASRRWPSASSFGYWCGWRAGRTLANRPRRWRRRRRGATGEQKG
jgi:hypothetical protein